MEISCTHFKLLKSQKMDCDVNSDSTMKQNRVSSAHVRGRHCTVSKGSSFFLVTVLLCTLVTGVSGSKHKENCPSPCSCNKDHIVFCNNKKLNITPLGFSSDVEKLYLFNNNISSILPATLKPLKNLKILDISGNRLSDIALWDGIFTRLRRLENLMLQKNRIARINRGMFVGLSNLARIYLQENRIEVIEPGAFDTLPNLIELKLGNNKINRFPRLVHTPRLLLLDLGNNQISTLRDMVFSTVNVEQLMLQNNMLTELRTSVFDDTSLLTDLDISNNRLTAIPQVIKSLTSLRSLNLSMNKMESKTIPQDTFSNLEDLKSLYMSGMGLKTLPPNIIPTNKIILNELDLTQNDWNCGCRMRWLSAYMRNFRVAMISPEEIICSTSSKIPGKKIIDLQESDFHCSSEELESLANSEGTTSEPTTTSTGHKNFINPCDVYHCEHGGTCYVEENMPKCRCTEDWSGLRCRTSLTTTTSTHAPLTTTKRTSRLTHPQSNPRPTLMIMPNSITEETVEIFLPRRNREMTLSINEIGQNEPPKEFKIVPKTQLFTVKNLNPGRSYNICIHLSLTNARASRRSPPTKKDTLCGSATTTGVKAVDTQSSKPDITVVPSPKATTKSVETSRRKETTIITKQAEESLSELGADEKLRGNKITPQTEPASDFSILYPAVGAGIGAVIVIIVIIMFCICRRQRRLLNLKKSPNTEYSPGTATDNHNEVEMATVVHHHHHNHYNAGSAEPNKLPKSAQSSPSSTIQNGSVQLNNINPKMSPSKTNNNHVLLQNISSRSSSRSSGISQPDTRYTSVQPHIPSTINPIPNYEQQNGYQNGYNIYRGHDVPLDPSRQLSNRQIPQRPQNLHTNSDTQPILSGNNTYYGANDSHLYPVSPINGPSYSIPSTGSVTYTPAGHNTHAMFQPIQSPMGNSPRDSMSGIAHRLSNSNVVPPSMACLSRNLVIESMPRYHDGVQVV